MSQPMQDRVERAMAHLKAAEQAAASARAELDAASVTARSTDRSVRVSVGAKGELTSLEFLDGKYRTMAAPSSPRRCWRPRTRHGPRWPAGSSPRSTR